MARIPKVLMFADGENLVFRYQELVASGRQPKACVTHIADEFVWSDEITQQVCYDILRASYYTSVTGDERKVYALRKAISMVGYDYAYSPDTEIPVGTGFLYPVVFKKDRKSRKSRSVDIQMTIDMFRHATRKDADQFLLLTGDGDFVPIIKEVMALGIEVVVFGFSSGLNAELEVSGDSYRILDQFFFEGDSPQGDQGE